MLNGMMIRFALQRLAAPAEIGQFRCDQKCDDLEESDLTLMHCWFCRLSLIAFAFVLSETCILANPDFGTSVINVSPESPLEGELVKFTIVLRNSGDTTATNPELSIEWPLMGFLIDATGADGLVIYEPGRFIRAKFSLEPNQEIPIELTVLAPTRSAGDVLSVSARLVNYNPDAEYLEQKSVDIKPNFPPDGIKLGGYRLTPAGIVILTCLIAGFVLNVWLRVLSWRAKPQDSDDTSNPGKRRRASRPEGIAIALTIAALFWSIFGMMAWRDLLVLTTWVETKAEIVGRRELVRPGDTSRSQLGRRPGEDSTSTPEFALKYDAKGETIYSTGFDTESSIRRAGKVLNGEELKTWLKGKVVTCWYNPRNPHDVVVRRGFGGAYFFALLPIPIFWIGISSLNHFLRRVSAKRQPT